MNRTVRSSPPDASQLAMRAAFRELHGRSLHGFALLVTLGDRPTAARLAEEALADAGERVTTLRHPERAAAWLRARVVGTIGGRPREPWLDTERTSLEPLDSDPGILHALATLSTRERAGLVAADVERLDMRDVEVVAGKSGRSLERLLVRARNRYAAAYPRVASPEQAPAGALVDRVRAVARRAMS